MKNLFLLLLLTSVSFYSNGQIIQEKIERFVKEKNIDNFLVYTRYLDGSFPSPDSCEWEEPQYLFWDEKELWYIKRFDYCHTYRPLLLDSINPLSFYLIHKRKIDKEEIREPKAYQTITRNGKKDVLIVTSTSSHQVYHTFKFFDGKCLKTISASDYNLQFTKFDNGLRNVNYVSNQKTKLKSLIDKTSKSIRNLNKEKVLDAE